MPNALGSVANETPETNMNAPPGQPDASSRRERLDETEAEHVRRLTEEALAIAGGAAGTGSANEIMSPSEGSDGNEMENDNTTVDDKFPDKVHTQPKNFTGPRAAIGATMVLRQLADSFPAAVSSDAAKALVNLAPLAVLGEPEQKRSGPMGVLTDIRFLAAVSTVGLAVTKRLTRGVPGRDVEITRFETPLPVGKSAKFRTTAPVEDFVRWESSDTEKAEVDDDGVVTGKTAGDVRITATLNGSSDFVNVTIQ
jgi:hypothetical protein